jgi:hypothetical protein
LAFNGKLKTFNSYQSIKEKNQFGLHLNLEDQLTGVQWEAKYKLGSISESQSSEFESKAYVESAFIEYNSSLSSFSFGILDKNFSHIEAISLMNKNESTLFVSPSENIRVGSPSIYYKKLFNSGAKFELLWQIDKSKARYLTEKDNIWFPDNRITNLNFDDVILILPDEPQFSITKNRELEAASLNNISLKYEKNFDTWDFGLYAFHGSSSPSVFYSFTASVTNFDGSIITAEPGIKIIPTYFKENSVVLFGTKLFENSILKFEIGHRKDASDQSFIDLNETAAQMQWETNSSFGDNSLLHIFLLTATNSKNDLNYRLAPHNFIYVLNWTSNSPWSHSLRLSKSLKFSTSSIAQISSKYEWNDYHNLGFSFSHFKSEDKDLINMYNEKHFASIFWEVLF